MIRALVAAAAIAGLAIATPRPASAGVLDISTESCSSFLEGMKSQDKATQSDTFALLWWLDGYNLTEEQATIIDFGAMKTNINNIIDDCSKNPTIALMTTSLKYMGANTSPKTSDVTDIATMTCEQALASSQNNTEGMGYILFWIAGYNASFQKDTVFDSDKWDKVSGEIGDYCRANPKVGLLTTAKKYMNPE